MVERELRQAVGLTYSKHYGVFKDPDFASQFKHGFSNEQDSDVPLSAADINKTPVYSLESAPERKLELPPVPNLNNISNIESPDCECVTSM